MHSDGVPLDREAQIARLRLPGVLRLIASAENRLLKLTAEQKEDQAEVVAGQVRCYRAELDRLEARAEGRVLGTPAPAEDLSPAVEEALRQLREQHQRDQKGEEPPRDLQEAQDLATVPAPAAGPTLPVALPPGDERPSAAASPAADCCGRARPDPRGAEGPRRNDAEDVVAAGTGAVQDEIVADRDGAQAQGRGSGAALGPAPSVP